MERIANIEKITRLGNVLKITRIDENGRGELEIVICDNEEKERALKEFERVFNKKVINL
nr:MAG TPA: hypothetical protein [Caudoviricetes sp.]